MNPAHGDNEELTISIRKTDFNEAVRLMGKIDKSCHEPVPQKILDDPILGKGSCPTYRCGVCSECSAKALDEILARIQAPEEEL